MQITPSHAILQGGRVEIKFPPQLYFTENASCLQDSFNSEISPSVECQISTELNMVKIINAFTDSDYSTLEAPISLSIGGIFTQRSMKPTTNFIFTTFDKDGYLIDMHRTSFLPPMNAALMISRARVIHDSEYVGDLATYDILVTSPYVLYDGDEIFIQIPDEASKTLAYSYQSCQPSTHQDYIADGLYCLL